MVSRNPGDEGLGLVLGLVALGLAAYTAYRLRFALAPTLFTGAPANPRTVQVSGSWWGGGRGGGGGWTGIDANADLSKAQAASGADWDSNHQPSWWPA